MSKPPSFVEADGIDNPMDWARMINGSAEFRESLQQLVETASGVFEAAGCSLRILDPVRGERDLLTAAGRVPACPEEEGLLKPSALEEARQNAALLIYDAATDPRLTRPEASVTRGIVSMIGLALPTGEAFDLMLWLYFDRALTAEEEAPRLHRSVSRQGALTVQQAFRNARYLETSRTVSAAIHQGEDVTDILNRMVAQIRKIMNARGCIYWIVDTARQDIHMKATAGFQMETLSMIRYETLEDVFRFHDETEVYISDVRDDPRIPSTTSLGKQMVRSILGISFSIAPPYKGILAVYFGRPRHLLDSEIEFIRASGRQGAVALHKAFRYDERMLNAFRETIEGLVLALEAKDVCTHGHSLNVANYACMAAREMGLSSGEIDTIRHAGLLHDIGKIAMRDAILINLGNLSPEDFATVKQHPVIGARIIAPLSFLSEASPLILYHHERYDGSGYPEGLTGEAIPLGARILAVSDSFDAMTSQRPGTRETLGVGKALARLLEQAGTSFDPTVVRAFALAIEAQPEAVRPVQLSEDYFSRHADALKGPEKRKSSLAKLLKTCAPGF